ITLSDRMENAGLLERVGGFAYLAELSKNTPSAANILAYAGVVAEKSRLRKLQSVGNMLVADVQALNARSSDVLEVAENQLFCIAEQGMLQAGT
ncbi:replicative DNA helicase, partial [Salmonella enterica]|nr:replicative DNA helicase [Salmonella enterica]